MSGLGDGWTRCRRSWDGPGGPISTSPCAPGVKLSRRTNESHARSVVGISGLSQAPLRYLGTAGEGLSDDRVRSRPVAERDEH